MMDRLTLPDKRINENTVWRSFVDVEAVREHAMDIYWRLKAYEDTNLTPEMVIELRNDALAINKELEEYKATGLTPEDIKKAFDENTVLKLAGRVLGVELDRLREQAAREKAAKIPGTE